MSGGMGMSGGSMGAGAAMGGMSGGGFSSGGGMGGGGDSADWQNAVDLKVSTQKVTVPCTRNTFKQYKIQVPRVVRETVPKTVKYIDMEKRTKQVPYTTTRCETRYRNDVQTYQEPFTRPVTKMVPVKTKEP